jgi:hypothetical protein
MNQRRRAFKRLDHAKSTGNPADSGLRCRPACAAVSVRAALHSTSPSAPELPPIRYAASEQPTSDRCALVIAAQVELAPPPGHLLRQHTKKPGRINGVGHRITATDAASTAVSAWT